MSLEPFEVCDSTISWLFIDVPAPLEVGQDDIGQVLLLLLVIICLYQVVDDISS